MAFMLAHPSMLRRIIIRFIETDDKVTRRFTKGYGSPIDFNEIMGMRKELAERNEYFLPSVLKESIDEIKQIKNLKKILF